MRAMLPSAAGRRQMSFSTAPPAASSVTEEGNGKPPESVRCAFAGDASAVTAIARFQTIKRVQQDFRIVRGDPP
jgi:hypothetical protein